jgi:hypothetical protein
VQEIGVASFVPDPTKWPFAPGASPFGIKGTVYKRHLEYVAEVVPGGVAASLEGLPSPDYARFFEQQFLAASFYDIFPLLVAAGPCATLMKTTAHDFVAKRARDQAPKDLNGVYRFLLAMVPTASVARRLPQLLQQMFNFGSAEALRDEPGSVSAAILGLPEVVAPWFSVVINAYGETALRVSGAKTASMVMRIGDVVGDKHGVPIVRCPVEIRWT